MDFCAGSLRSSGDFSTVRNCGWWFGGRRLRYGAGSLCCVCTILSYGGGRGLGNGRGSLLRLRLGFGVFSDWLEQGILHLLLQEQLNDNSWILRERQQRTV